MTGMRIIDLQRRLREVGRIRTGDTTIASNGKGRPRKLERFRLTSRDRKVIDVAAATYGGQTAEWSDAPDGRQWQVYIEADELAVVVPPGDMAFSQAYEQWTAGGCRVRCDGQWDHLRDQACACDPSDRECNIHTRLSVMVPDLPGVGVWRLETHSYYAAVELAGLVDLCAQHAAAGRMLPARLRLEQRSVKRINAKTKKVETRRFAVPVLDIDVHPLALGAGTGVAGQLAPGAMAELDGVATNMPALQAAPAITPVPQSEAEAALRPTVAEQVAAVDDERVMRGGRRQAEVPRTGLRPRTMAEATEVAEAEHVAAEVSSPPSAAEPPMPEAPDDIADGPPERRGIDVRELARKSRATFGPGYAPDARSEVKAIKRLRYAVTYAQTGGRAWSSSDLEPNEMLQVWQRMDDIAAGRIAMAVDDTGVTFTSGSGKVTRVGFDQVETAK